MFLPPAQLVCDVNFVGLIAQFDGQLVTLCHISDGVQ